jgi:PqqD family protein of HPr-rel-A system
MERSALNPEPRWLTPLFPQLRLYPLEDEYAAFNPLSGQTHFLNELSLEVLRLLHESDGLSESQIVDAFSDGCDSAEVEAFRLSLGTHIHHLDELGLITRADN